MKLRVANASTVFLLGLSLKCLAQTAATPEIGVNPYKSYSGGDIDHIQMQNGSLYLRIPLLSYPQLGKLSLSFSVLANGSQWQEYGYCDSSGNCEYSYGNGYLTSLSCPGSPGNIFASGTGNGSAQIVVDQDLGLESCSGSQYEDTDDPGGIASWYFDWNTYSVVDSSEAVHTLGFNQSNWSQLQAADGSGYMAIIPSVPTMATTSSWQQYFSDQGYCPSAWIYESNGVQHTFTCAPPGANYGSPTVTFQDPNPGNSITRYSYAGSSPTGVIVDSVNRHIEDPAFATNDPDTSACPNLGVSGQAAQISQSWTVPGYNGSQQTFHFCYTTINVDTNFFGNGVGAQTQRMIGENDDGSYYYAFWDETDGTIQVLQSVVLPNKTYWGFVYDSATSQGQASYGDMLQVILPSGGSINYSYTTIPMCGEVPGPEANQPFARAATSRQLNPLTGTPLQRTYNYLGPTYYGSPTALTIETDASGNDTVHQFTIDYPSTNDCGAEETATKWYQGTSNNGTSGTILKEVDTSYNYQLSPQGAYYNSFPSHTDVMPHAKATYLNGQLQNSVTYSYDTLFTDSEPYFIDSGWSDGSIIGPNTASISYEVPTTVSDSVGTTTTTRYATMYPAFQSAGMLSLPGVVSKYDSGNNLVQQTTYTYDAPTCSPAGVFGNLTSTMTDYGVTTSRCYNNAGMPTAATDANGNTTNYSYDLSGLYIKQAQRPTTDGVPHVSYYQQDPNTGWVTAIADENATGITDTGHTSKFNYDVVGRLISAQYPDGGWATQCYTDEGGSSYGLSCGLGSAPFSVIAQRAQSGSVTLNSSAEYDGLGRSIGTTDPAGAVVNTTYDQNGHVASVSNRYFTANGQGGVTSYLYDPLGRKSYQCQPDNLPLNATVCSPNNSYESWTYSGTTTNFTDENNHTWARTTDAHDRLVQVLEPGGLATTYSYDSLDNLLGVNQAGNGSTDAPRYRTFTYDALSRLACASNPENSSAPCPSSYTGSYTSGTTGYTYDGNGNVLTNTSPSVNLASGSQTIGYSYDGLSRLCYKVLGGAAPSQSPQGCPSSEPANVIAQYWYDSSSLSNTVNTIGHLTDEKSYSGSTLVSERQPYRFDPMGRLWNESQCSFGHCFAPAYTYDLAGNLITSTDGVTPSPTAPSGTLLTFTNSYDSGGRLQTVTSNWSNGTSYPATIFSEGIQVTAPCPFSTNSTPYAASGDLMNATFGVGSSSYSFTLNHAYDNRQRITCEIDQPAP